MKIRERSMALLLALMMALGLTACGKKAVEAEPYNGIVYVGEDLPLDAELQRIKGSCVLGDFVYLAGHRGGGTLELMRLPLAGGGMEVLPEDQPYENGNYYSIDGGLQAGPDGTLWLWERISIGDDFDGRVVLRQMDAEGKLLFRSVFEKSWTELEQELGLGILRGFLIDGEGDLAAWCNEGVAVLDQTGEIRFTLEADAGLGGLALFSDGRIGLSDQDRSGDGDRYRLRVIDKEAKGWGETYPLPSGASVYAGDENALFYYTAGDELWAWRMGEDGKPGEGERVLNFLDSGIDQESVAFFAFLPDGKLAVTCGQRFEEGSKRKVSVLAPVEAASLPEKKVLTYAAFNLDSNERAAILEFNRTNPEYMISVTDYGQYGGGNMTDGMTRLITEIGAGRIPDILSTWFMPTEQWGAKGLLEDLWPWIDKDPELNREDLMIRVLEASEIDGKLYEVSDGFQIWTMAGARSVVGDRYSWTPEEMWEAVEKMPEGCVPMRTDSRSQELLDLLRLDWSRFVDWKKGSCHFDSEEFREVLEFCGSIPAGEEADLKDENRRLLDREQLLMNQGIYNLLDLQVYRFFLGDEVSFVGYPNPWGKVGSSFILTRRLAMSSTCRNKDAAWSFIRQMLLPQEGTGDGYFWAYPINRADFQRRAEFDMRSTAPNSTYQVGESEVTLDIQAATQEDLDQVMALYEQIDTAYRWDEPLEEIITDVAGAYFAGDKTLDETAALIQNRAQLYVSERT